MRLELKLVVLLKTVPLVQQILETAVVVTQTHQQRLALLLVLVL
jgi:hypothetical protein